MQILSFFLVLAFVAVVAEAGRFFPALNKLPLHWESVETKPIPSTLLTLRVALHPKDAKALENNLLEVATPGSKRFRQYLKKEEITAIVGRSDSDIERLRSVFAKEGLQITSVHPHRDWVFVEATVEQIEKFFQCKLGLFRHKERNTSRMGKYILYVRYSSC